MGGPVITNADFIVIIRTSNTPATHQHQHQHQQQLALHCTALHCTADRLPLLPVSDQLLHSDTQSQHTAASPAKSRPQRLYPGIRAIYQDANSSAATFLFFSLSFLTCQEFMLPQTSYIGDLRYLINRIHDISTPVFSRTSVGSRASPVDRFGHSLP
ncbi:hypothetical protein CTA1_3327 [Colletotrichum tanaceti]|uniref:Uncharacterized protein n=1 Tax=Colletotrichum tanaceti TaxID=1306861 RepID=A0A4U6X8G4_9PEZI|nr:hypothetical protein CTA1_3327 [Colletotrichum tanaceti]